MENKFKKYIKIKIPQQVLDYSFLKELYNAANIFIISYFTDYLKAS